MGHAKTIMSTTPSITSKEIGFVVMPSRASSTFADARPQIAQIVLDQAGGDWVYFVPKLGAVSKTQEVSLGSMWDFLEKAMDPIGSITHEGDPMIYIAKRDDPIF